MTLGFFLFIQIALDILFLFSILYIVRILMTIMGHQMTTSQGFIKLFQQMRAGLHLSPTVPPTPPVVRYSTERECPAGAEPHHNWAANFEKRAPAYCTKCGKVKSE